MSPDTRSSSSPPDPEQGVAGRILHAPHLITRPTAEAQLATGPVRVQGRFGYEKIHARTGLVVQSGEFDNLITDDGLNALGTAGILSLVRWIAVGKGQTEEPGVGDPKLETEVGRTDWSGGYSDASGYDGSDPARPFHWYRKVYVFREDQANDSLTELGLFNASSGGVMWNRQRFRDANGQATVITKTAEEQLKLFYEWRIYPPLGTATQVFTVAGTPVTVTNSAQAINVTNHWGATSGYSLLTHFGEWNIGGKLYETMSSGSWYSQSSRTTAPYVDGSLQRDGELRWEPNHANTQSGKIALLTVAPTGEWDQFRSAFSPVLTKTPDDRVVVQVRFTWDRATL